MFAQMDFFNSMAEKWDERCYHDPVKIDRMLDMLNIQKGAACLDVGTGTGVMIPFLHKRAGDGGKIVAVDMADQMLKVAQRKNTYPNVDFVLGDVLEGDLPGGFFDAVICYCVFPHFAEKQAALRILQGYLKKGGMLLIGHSQSRGQINHMHKSAPEAVADAFLPEMDIIRSYMTGMGMEIVAWADNSDMFAVAARK